MTSVEINDNNDCFNIISIIKRKFRSDDGFSGVTHAMTGVIAVELIFISAIIFGWGDEWLKFSFIPLIIAFSLTIIGGTLIPDLDNTRSTSHSAFGPIGSILSYIFRASSVIAQTFIRTRKDDASPNPHRGLWHTLISSVFLGLVVFGLTSISSTVNVPLFGEVTVGSIIALIVFCSMVHLFLAALAKPFVRKLKNAPLFGDLIAFLVSSVLGLSLFYFIDNKSYLWLGMGLAIGCMVHIIGDTFTKQGTPMFFPLSVFTKGRFWWYVRFAQIESGGKFEKTALSKLLSIMSVVLLVILIVVYFTF